MVPAHSCWRFLPLLLGASALSCVPEPAEPGPSQPVEAARVRVSGRIPTVLAADFDGDGIDELAIADTSAGEYPRTESGLVRVLSGPVGSGGWRELPVRLSLAGERPFARFGLDMAACDLDADGVADLALRADTSPEGSGRICVVSGRLTGEHGIETAAFLTLEGPATLGQTLLMSDYNADGIDDLVVSCPLRSEVYVLLGPKRGRLTLPDAADVIFSTASGSLGWTVAQGDLNHDGAIDLALSEPIGNSIFLVPGGLAGRQAAGQVAWAVVRSSSPTDYIAGADNLVDDDGRSVGLLVRGRRTDTESVGIMFVLPMPVSGDVDVRRDAISAFEYEAAVTGSSGCRVSSASTGAGILALGTPGRSQIPDSNLKGGVWLVSPGLQGELVLDETALGASGSYLRPQDLNMDWLGTRLLTGRVLQAGRRDLIVIGEGIVLVLVVP